MRTIKIELSEGVYEMINNYAIKRNQPIEKILSELVVKFAPITHTMKEEEIKKGYEDTAEINSDWANL